MVYLETECTALPAPNAILLGVFCFVGIQEKGAIGDASDTTLDDLVGIVPRFILKRHVVRPTVNENPDSEYSVYVRNIRRPLAQGIPTLPRHNLSTMLLMNVFWRPWTIGSGWISFAGVVSVDRGSKDSAESFLLCPRASDSCVSGKGWFESGGVEGGMGDEFSTGVVVDGREPATTPEKAPFSFSEDRYSWESVVTKATRRNKNPCNGLSSSFSSSSSSLIRRNSSSDISFDASMSLSKSTVNYEKVGPNDQRIVWYQFRSLDRTIVGRWLACSDPDMSFSQNRLQVGLLWIYPSHCPTSKGLMCAWIPSSWLYSASIRVFPIEEELQHQRQTQDEGETWCFKPDVSGAFCDNGRVRFDGWFECSRFSDKTVGSRWYDDG